MLAQVEPRNHGAMWGGVSGGAHSPRLGVFLVCARSECAVVVKMTWILVSGDACLYRRDTSRATLDLEVISDLGPARLHE